MRVKEILMGIMVATPLAYGACGGAGTLRDWGLHRAWRVERDCRHPEWPAVLVEVPWGLAERSVPSGGDPAGKGSRMAPEVRAGMRVAVTRQDENADIHLAGTALGTAHTGERVAFHVSGYRAILHGTVRGPGLVELEMQKGDR